MSGKNWNDNKPCRIMTGWPLSDIDQIANKDFFKHQQRIVDFNLDAKRLVGEIAAAGTEVFYFHAKSHSGNVWFETELGTKFSCLGERDLVRELIAECKKNNISTVGMFQIVCDKRAHDERPEWRQINSEGEDCKVSPRVCFNNLGYREYALSLLKEAVGKYDLDGVMIDEFDFNGRGGGGQMCYCSSCKELYSKRFNAEMPVREDWQDQQWLNFIRFRFDSLTAFIKDVRDAVKAVNPDVLLSIVSYSGIYLPWQRLQPLESFAEYLDYFSLDTRGSLSTSLYCRIFKSYGREKGEIISGVAPVLAHCISEPSLQEQNSKELLQEAMTVIANNLSWNVDVCYKPLPRERALDASMLDYYRQAADEVKKREPWLTGKQRSVADMALFYSEDSKIFYGRNSPELYLDEFLGYFSVMLNSNRLFDVIGMRHLTAGQLKRYKVIVLPNAVCLGDAALAVFREYVRNGGRLIASYKTSLCDGEGRERADFGLSDVFGASFKADGPGGDYSLRVENLKKLDYGFYSAKTATGLTAPSVLPTAVVELCPGQAATTGELYHRREGANNFIPGYTKSYCPDDTARCLTTEHRFGQGQAIFLGAKFGALYQKTALAIARNVITDAIEHSFAGSESIKVEAPGCIEATAFVQDEKRLIVHLTNRQDGPERVDFCALLFPSLYEPREILPVYNIRISLPGIAADNIAKAYVAPAREPVEAAALPDGGIVVNIPVVEHHAMLVVELKNGIGYEKI